MLGSMREMVALGVAALGLVVVGAPTEIHAKVQRSTPLLDAIATRQAKTALALLAKGADPNEPNSDGVTPLALAIRGAWPEFARVIDALLAKGADVSARDRAGYTPLMEAASTGDVRTAELLVARGASVKAAADDGTTPLFLAARGRPAMVDFLLARGADPNAATRSCTR
jgi:ankyrin repeat protein